MKTEIQNVCHDTAQELFAAMMIVQEESEEAADKIQELALFLESCGWGIAFGGTFGDEIILVLNEVLDEHVIYYAENKPLRGLTQDVIMYDEIGWFAERDWL